MPRPEPKQQLPDTSKVSGRPRAKGVAVKTFRLPNEDQAEMTLPAGWVPFAALGPIIYAWKA
jgi:hypothetical protein